MASVFFHLALISFLAVQCFGYRIGRDPFRRGADLADNNRFHLEWTVDHIASRIVFNITVQTRGWILFGLANNGSDRTGRDVVIGGVDKGQPYLWDSHTGETNTHLVRDLRQDYRLEGYWESTTHTFLSFSRNLDTCDEEDYLITENRITLVWAYGDNDKVPETGSWLSRSTINRGTYDIFLLDPEFSPQVVRSSFQDPQPRLIGHVPSNTKVWSVPRTTPLPSNHTSYFCTIHKAPTLPRKHHVIGFDVEFADEESRAHSHHLLVFKCRAPQGSTARALFEKFARSGQQETCFNTFRPVVGRDMPMHFCTQTYFIWGFGGRQYFNPDDVGFPFGESADEYYMFQWHYDNPDMRSDITVTLRTDFFYTTQLRKNEGGLLFFGHEAPGTPLSLTVPPQTTDARVFGHCSGACTERMFPEEGVTLVAAWLHTHNSGEKIRLHHFRGNRELPWILYDDNYSNTFQRVRAFPQGPVQVQPGDQLTLDCTYDNTWTNGTVVSGYSTRQEMCSVFIVHHTYVPDYSFCRSEIRSGDANERFLGIRNFTWVEPQLDWVANAPGPRHLVGRTVGEISDNFVTWTPELREELRQFQLHQTHVGLCSRDPHVRSPREIQEFEDQMLELQRREGARWLLIPDNEPADINTVNDFAGPVNYPVDAVPYALPERTCGKTGNASGFWRKDKFLNRMPV